MATVDAGSLYTSINNALQVITPANVTDPIEFWLAFLLILAILNTVLKKVSFFTEESNKVARALTALIISFFAVTVVWVSPVLVYMSSTLAVTAVILVAILVIAAMTGYDTKGGAKWLFIVAIVVLFIGGGLFSWIFVPSGSGGVSGFSGSSSGVNGVGSALAGVLASIGIDGWVWILLLGVGVGIIYWLFSSQGGSSGKSSG